MVKLLFILSMVFLSSQGKASFSLSSLKWNDLNDQQKFHVTEELKTHLKYIEASHQELVSYKFELLNSAYASEYNCFVAGWPSSTNAQGSCQDPAKLNPYHKNYLGCPSGELLCNPALFGDGLCIEFKTSVQKNSAFAQCEKSYQEEGRSFSDVLESSDEKEFSLLLSTVNENCHQKKERLSSCEALKHRLQFFVPDEIPKGNAAAAKALKSAEPEQMMKSAKALQSEMEDELQEFSRACKAPIAPEKKMYCKNISIRVKNAKALLTKLHTSLDSKLDTDCVNCSKDKFTHPLSKVALPEFKKPLACTDEEKKVIRSKCGEEISCAIASTILSGPTALLETFGQKPGKCLASQNSCVTNFISALVDSLISLVTGIWDILGSIAHWGGEKLANFWTYVTTVENKTSDAQHLINKMNQEDVKAVKTNPIQWITSLAKNIWSGIDLWMKEDIFCEKWAGIPRASKCEVPMRKLECLGCRTVIAGTCSVAGVIATEIIPAFLTGGTVNLVARGANGASEFAKVIRASKSYKKVVNSVEQLNRVKALKVTGAAVAKTTQVSASIIVSPLKASYQVSAKGYKALINSPKYQSLEKAMSTASKYTGLSALSSAQTKASSVGFEFIDTVLGSTGISFSNSQSAKILGAFQERQRTTAAVRKELRPLNKIYSDIYQKGSEYQKLQARYIELSFKKNPSKEILNEMHDLDMKGTFLSQEMDALNDVFLNSIHDIYKKKGFPSKLVTDKDGRMVLKLNFDSPPTGKHAFEFYREISQKFGLKEVTLSLKENAQHGFGGFFLGSASRLEMGPQQAISLLEEYINSVGKHEGRHAMFFAKRAKGDDSIYHTTFHARGEKLLNDVGMYDRYMSVEEIYTYSTDLQTLAQTFKGKYLTDAKARDALVSQIEGGNDALDKLAKASSEVSESMIKSLVNKLNGKSTEKIMINPYENGSFEVQFADEFGRGTSMQFVSDSEKKLLSTYMDLEKKKVESLDVYLNKKLIERNIDPATISEKLSTGKATLEEKSIVMKMVNDFDQSSEGLKFASQAEGSIKEIIIQSKIKLEGIKKVADHQRFEASILQEMIAKYQKNPTPEQLKLLKNQMFRMAKNVKEDYKGFILK